MTQQQSNVIKVLRFPLMLGVVLIHSRVTDANAAWENGLYLTSAMIDICTRFITCPCVPLFFFFSGFLFFASNKFNQGNNLKIRNHIYIYIYKLQKKARTLLVPYIFWNAAIICFFALLHIFASGIINPTNHNIFNYTWQEIIRCFWNYPDNMPINYPFWFLRDLMIMIVCSPIVYVAAKYGKWVLPMILIGLFVCNLGFPKQLAITFFTLGASFGIHQWDFTLYTRRFLKYTFPLWIVMIGILTCIHSSKFTTIITPVLCVLGAMVYLGGASYIKDNKAVTFLSSSSFFVFAFHGIPVQFLINALISILHPTNDATWVLVFVMNITIIIALSLSIYWFLSKCLPKFTAIITGGR